MKKLKHSKFRNTGFIFDALTKFAMREALDPSIPQHALKLIRRHFAPNTLLLRELRLYQSLTHPSDHDPKELFQLTQESRKRLNQKELLKEKYSLVRSINKCYNSTVFFETKTNNYKVTASIYKLFEFDGQENPLDYLNCKKFIVEHLSGKQPETVNEVEQQIRELDPDIRKLSFKILIERFNHKYHDLNIKQRTLLSKYINENVSREDFKNYVVLEVGSIVKELSSFQKKLTNEITKIKLSETLNLAQNIVTAKVVKEEHLNSMLKFYELIEVLKK